jgi:hypothetical protein
MQVAEVGFLAVTEGADCSKARFLTQPVDQPVLEGSTATFAVQVNGPWPLQWYMNGEKIPGASGTSYTTDPITSDNSTNTYSVKIVGCEMSNDVQAKLFTPSDVKSVGINFMGGGANGAPTSMNADDVAGIQLQAYWNNLTNSTETSYSGLVDSDNNASSITMEYASSGTWGSGTGSASPTQRMLNGLIYANPGAPAHITFNNVPSGSHTIIAYLVGIPLEFHDAEYWVVGQNSQTNYVSAINSDQYNPAPGFYRGSSTDPANRTLASYVRFDNVQPVNGVITLNWSTETTGFDRGAPVNAVQLLLNAPPAGDPPVITSSPKAAVMVEGGALTLHIEATGDNLTYQWRKNGKNLPDGGNISGATTASLSIGSFSADDNGVYSVAVFNSAGSIISKNASIRLSKYDITDQLIGYWKFDETSGNTAANSAANGQAAALSGTTTWGAGQIGNALTFDGSSTYGFVPDYPKANLQLSGSVWVNIDPNVTVNPLLNAPVFIQNAIGNGTGTLAPANPAEQFNFRTTYQDIDQQNHFSAAIAVGPNIARVIDPDPTPMGEWDHVAFSADGATLHLYLNGKEIATADYIKPINPPDFPWLSIGGSLDGTSGSAPYAALPDFMQGQMDDLAIWDRALTPEEVTAIYQAGLAGKDLTTVVETPPEVTTPGTLQIAIADGQVTVTWDRGTLQTATSITGPWTDVTDPSPVTEAASEGTKFYRTVQ